MKTLRIGYTNAFVKASIPNSLSKGTDFNNKVQIIRRTDTQTLRASSSEFIQIQYDPKLVATIIKNKS